MTTKLKQKKDEIAIESVRFTDRVIAEFQSGDSSMRITDFQKSLIPHYFIGLTKMLSDAETKRAYKDKNNETPAYSWANVDINAIAPIIVSYSKMGLDPIIPNHISGIPYLNKKTKKYEFGFIEGYKGKELIASKYGLDFPKNVITKLVYSNEQLIPRFKDINQPYDCYEFVPAENPFDLGNVVGGFYYLEYEDNTKNKLKVISLKDILKRKPKYAAVEFWGGEKAIWKNGQRTSKTETVEGWAEEMYLKTIKRMAYDSFVIDPAKIDEAFVIRETSSENILKLERDDTILKNANKETLDIDDAEEVKTPEIAQVSNDEKEELKEDAGILKFPK